MGYSAVGKYRPMGAKSGPQVKNGIHISVIENLFESTIKEGPTNLQMEMSHRGCLKRNFVQIDQRA